MAWGKQVYRCKYCDYQTDKLYGSYLCPRCRHILIPIKPVDKKDNNAAVVVLSLLVIAISLFFIVRELASNLSLRLPEAITHDAPAVTVAPQSAPSATAPPELTIPPTVTEAQVTADDYLLSDVTTDVRSSMINGKKYLVIEGKISATERTLYHNALLLTLQQNGKQLYMEEHSVETLVPGEAKPFHFEIDTADISGYDPTQTTVPGFQVRGKTTE